MYYVVREGGIALHARADASSQTVARIPFRDGVRVLADEGPWSLVAWSDARGTVRGYVPAGALSNVWVRVDKSERTLYLYEGARLARELPADVSVSPEDKERRSELDELEHYRIPEGTFFVTRLHDTSQYYRAFVLNYPNAAHAERGVREGLITQEQYERIVEAERNFREPPMGTRLGGMIEIHGDGSGRRRAWTRGCVALRNIHMDDLWSVVRVGTPVIIEP